MTQVTRVSRITPIGKCLLPNTGSISLHGVSSSGKGRSIVRESDAREGPGLSRRVHDSSDRLCHFEAVGGRSFQGLRGTEEARVLPPSRCLPRRKGEQDLPS